MPDLQEWFVVKSYTELHRGAQSHTEKYYKFEKFEMIEILNIKALQTFKTLKTL
jgi:hypothetical protein